MIINNKRYFEKQPISYWLASAFMTNYPALEEDITVDIAIVGGGLAGIQCAYQLEKEGFKIAVLEATHIGHGASGHTTAKITSQHSLIYDKIQNQLGSELAKQYATANETAIHEIKKIAEENNIDCEYISQSSFVYTQQDEYLQKIHDEVKAASSLGIKASYIENIPFPIPIKGAVRFDNQAQFHPLKYLFSLAEIIHNKGVQIYEQTRIVDIEESDNYVIVTSHGKKITAEKVIIASHYPFYNKHGMYFARIYTSRTYIVGIRAKEKYPGGMYINAEKPTRSLRHQNIPGGELILVVGDEHKTGQGEDMNRHYGALIDFASEVFTIEDVPFRWSTQDCMTLDGIPYIGKFTSNTPNLYVATGFQKWGMTNSTVSSLILKDLIIKGESPWQDVYDPSRKTIAASTKNFIVQNADVAKHLVKGKLSSLDKDIDIQNGEGKVLEIDGNRVGAYRDEEGKLYLVNTTCTHMGCELNWNSAERSWDCPCHGSRFSYQGEILEGPSVSPLKVGHDVNTIEKLFKDDF